MFTQVREYTKFHDRILSSLRNQKKIIFLDSPRMLDNYIVPDQQKLPGVTISLDEDLKVILVILWLVALFYF